MCVLSPEVHYRYYLSLLKAGRPLAGLSPPGSRMAHLRTTILMGIR